MSYDLPLHVAAEALDGSGAPASRLADLDVPASAALADLIEYFLEHADRSGQPHPRGAPARMCLHAKLCNGEWLRDGSRVSWLTLQELMIAKKSYEFVGHTAPPWLIDLIALMQQRESRPSPPVTTRLVYWLVVPD